MHYQLDEKSNAFIAEQLSLGQFPDAESVIRESLRLLEKREQEKQQLRAHIERALASPKRYTAEEVMENVRARLRHEFPA